MSPLDGIVRVVADSDLDGLMAAAVLKASNPQIEVHFAHPALLRGGSLDHLIDRSTAICDLPFHPNCGWYLDHHQTNRPTNEEEKDFIASGGICNWEASPSAARVAYDLLSQSIDLSHLEEEARSEFNESHVLEDGDKLWFAAVGAGWTWGAGVMSWEN